MSAQNDQMPNMQIHHETLFPSSFIHLQQLLCPGYLSQGRGGSGAFPRNTGCAKVRIHHGWNARLLPKTTHSHTRSLIITDSPPMGTFLGGRRELVNPWTLTRAQSQTRNRSVMSWVMILRIHVLCKSMFGDSWSLLSRKTTYNES